MFEPMRVWMQCWMDGLTNPFLQEKGDRYFTECMALMSDCMEQFEHYGSVPDHMMEDLEFKLAVYNREKYAQEDDE